MITIDKVPEFLIISAIRYAIGRRTYIVNDTVEYIIANWNNFSDWLKSLIETDIERAIKQHEHSISIDSTVKWLGNDCDVQNWMSLRQLWNK